MSNKENMLSSKELVLEVENIFVQSGFIINSFCDLKNGFLRFELNKNGVEYIINTNVRNVGSAYLPNKPYIMRRQVGKMNLDDIPVNSGKTVSMLLAIATVNDERVLVCWNPFYYVGHSTNRSCYVLQNSLEAAQSHGFYDGIDCKTPVLVCSNKKFERLLSVYLERNVVD